ncbi:uncharacterized protein MEPE_01451 [Melanopsichium pennsylvanicum]|uniref:peptidyl-tRNA hydrolase n=1 Tax=Melanopsichium pennsylvanicum TaxID=63383 RepID=A0AAJ4XHS1_9BASI|nr:uncharacterized protein MEPE_01451 [Melanopsichium pennsylvanicum]
MQLIVDGESSTLFKWPKGSWMAQCAHASIAVIQLSLSTSILTQEYIHPNNINSMHKVVLQTASSGKTKMNLVQLSQKLSEVRNKYEEEIANRQEKVSERKGKGEGEGEREKQGEEEEFPQHWLWIEQPENIPTCLAIAPNRKPASLRKILRSCTLLKD